MGLDAVEIVLRAEELYAVTIPDVEADSIRTVGDFYRLLCARLDLTPLPSPVTPTHLPRINDNATFLRKRTPLPAPPEVLPWSPQSVWDTLVALLVDQQGLDPADILPTARFAEDLGVD